MSYRWTACKDTTCPKCNNIIESAIDNDAMEGAERCTYCKWQINFEPNTHRVRYGTHVTFATDDTDW